LILALTLTTKNVNSSKSIRDEKQFTVKENFFFILAKQKDEISDFSPEP
jgi:hypothetical protein